MKPIITKHATLLRLTLCTLTILTLADLTGCAPLQRTDPYAKVPQAGSIKAEQSPIRATEKKAEKPDLQEPLTLDRAVQYALDGNPEIAAIQWDIAAAEAKIDTANSARWPALNAEGGRQYFLDDQRLIAARKDGEKGIFDPDISRGDLVLKIPLFTGGRLTSEVGAAELFRLAEDKRLARSREELVFNVSSTFYAILSQHEVIRSLEFSITAMEEHRKQVSDLLAAQKAARVDLLRTEVRLADLNQSRVKEQNILAVQRRLLINLMGMDDPADQLVIKGELPAGPAMDLTAADMIPAALEKRSDYLAARARLEAQARRVDIARAGYWPTVSLLANYGIRATGSGDSEDVGAVGLGFSVPLFDGGRTEAQVRQENAALSAAQERLRKLEQQIRREVETAILDIQSASQRIDAVRLAVEQARESLRIQRMKYDLGSGPLTDVLDAQSALLQSETNYARALADSHIAEAKLRLAKGEE
jgi:outer membrane protein TolC